MTTTQEIPAGQLGGLNLHRGDTLLVLEERGDKMLVQIARKDQKAATPSKGAAAEWVRKYSGILKLAEGQTLDDLRMDQMREKYGME
jgi:hypothetical protein